MISSRYLNCSLSRIKKQLANFSMNDVTYEVEVFVTGRSRYKKPKSVSVFHKNKEF